jgi:branched-chain amino acid transport system ATP-binding protein
MLRIENISAGYGDLQVLFNLSLEINQGECVALLGSNGAGKTTLLQIISGIVPVTNGSIWWFNQNLLDLPAYDRAELGIAHIPQGRGILSTMSVYDNLVLGTIGKRVRQNRNRNIEMVYDTFPWLRKRTNQIAGSLSGGEQQMLSIARALCMEPKLLILDEPSLGLAPIIVSEVFDAIKSIKEAGVSIFIVEQNLTQALSLSDRGYVMENGHIVISDSSENLLNNQDIKKAYLGI